MFLCHEEEKVGQQHLATWGVQRPCKRCVELKAGDDFDKSSEDRINGKESPPLPVFLTFKYRKIPSANQMLGEISMVKAVWLGSSVTASSCRKVQLMAILKNPCGSTGHEVPIWNLPEVAPSSAWNICISVRNSADRARRADTDTKTHPLVTKNRATLLSRYFKTTDG